MKKLIIFTALICAGLSLKAQVRKDTLIKFSYAINRGSNQWEGTSIKEYSKTEFEMPGAKYKNGNWVITDTLKAMTAMINSYSQLGILYIEHVKKHK